MNRVLTVALVVALAALLWFTWSGIRVEIRPQLPAPALPVLPRPLLPDLPKPCPGPLCPKETELVGAKVAGPIAPDGTTEVHCDLPAHQHTRNVTSRGQGCCTQTSVNHAARFQNVPGLIDFHKWVQEKGLPGGGMPRTIDARLPACCKERGYPVPPYLQITNSADLTPLKLACQSGRMVSVTYVRSPTGRYGGSRISHMLNMVHCDDQWIGLLDNNYVADAQNPNKQVIEWVTPREFLTICNDGSYWAVILLTPPPSPPPRNL